MKIPNLSASTHRKREDGVVAVIVMLALLALVLAFIIANLNTLSELRGELKRVEKRQIRRLGYTGTNVVQAVPASPR
jgi:hypothetical protein